MIRALRDPAFRLDLAAIALVLVGAAALGLASRQWALVAVPAALAVLRPLVGRRLVIAPRPIVYLFVVLGFLLLARARPVPGAASSPGFNIPFHVAVGLLVGACGRLWSRPDPQRLPHVLLAGLLALAASGADMSQGEYRAVVSAAGLPVLWLLRGCLGTTEPLRGARLAGKLGLLAVPVLAVCAATYGGSEVWRRNYNDLDAAFMTRFRNVAPKSGGGFSGTAGLGSVERLRGDSGHEVALRAFSQREPGYLRAKVFVEYHQGEWAASGLKRSREDIAPDRQEETDTVGRVTLPGHPAPAADRSADLAVYPIARYGGAFFMPLATQAFATAAPTVTVHPGGWCESAGDSNGYDVFLDARPPAEDAGDPAYTSVPEHAALRAALDATVKKLERRDGSVAEAVRAVARHFARNYRYEIGIKIEPDEDPVAAFLTRIDHGHCEFFASSGVLLLRRMGFAARYVTGFVCSEKSPVGDVWLARQEHAHAWVEVFDPSVGGWTTAEFTPESGQPHLASTAGTTAWLEWATAQAQRVLAVVWRVGPVGVFRVLGAWLLGRWYRALGLLAVVGYVLWRRRRRPAARVTLRASVLPEGLASERERLRELERRLAREGLGRGAGETLHEWAARLEATEHAERGEIGAFLRDYGARRYAPFAAAS